MRDLKDSWLQLRRALDDASEAGESRSYGKLAAMLTELEAHSREYLQEITKYDVHKIIEKLRSTQELTKEELGMVKTWLVGDAEYYTKLENNFRDWLSELKRLIDETGKLSESAPNFESALHLRALLKDAIRTVWDIHHYLEHKERLANFDDSTQDLDVEERELLVQILQQKLRSAEF